MGCCNSHVKALLAAPYATANWLEAALPHNFQLEKISIEADARDATERLAQHPAEVVFLYCDSNNRSHCISAIAALTQAHAETCVVAIADDAQSADLELAAIRAGAREFLVGTRDAGNLDHVLNCCQAAVNAHVQPQPQAQAQASSNGKVVTVLSALPDRGSVWFAMHLALAGKPERTLLVDMASPVAASLSFLNIVPGYSVAQAISDRERIDSTLVETAFTRHASGLTVLAGSADEPTAMPPLAGEFAEFLDIVSAQFEQVVIIIDSLQGASNCAVALNHASHAYLLADATVLASQHAHALLAKLRQADTQLNPLALVLDRSEWSTGLEPERMSQLLGLRLAGRLQGSPEARLTAMNAGEALFHKFPRDGYWREVQSIAHTITGDTAANNAATAKAAEHKGLLGWFREAVGA